ncbi:uncharacterized protein [Typha angustifolia]|uniref:uncharacterized protein isoform X1 n=1 Tax=Typha angustifolia TaxID=59011 RepID=UPI003C2FAF33
MVSDDPVIMPPSDLDVLHSCALIVHCYLNSTMMPLDVSHCGVLEFVAEEGFIYMAYQVMQNMLLQERETVRVKNVTLPKAWKQLLRNFSCLTTGDNIMVAYNNKKYYTDTVELKPASANGIIETECEGDFIPPLNYEEPEN